VFLYNAAIMVESIKPVSATITLPLKLLLSIILPVEKTYVKFFTALPSLTSLTLLPKSIV
jgi:hypothetical protein